MTWYHEWFNEEEYLLLYQHRDEEEANLLINLIEKEINLKLKSKVLDLCCGNGRHSILLSKRGYSVTGVDLSDNLLNIARKNAEINNLDIKFIQSDMKEINFNNEFDLTLNLFTSFGYFSTDEENENVIKNIYRALKNKSYLVIDFLNKEYLLKNIEPETVSNINNSTIIQKRKIVNNKVIKEIIIEKNNNKKYFREEVILYSLNDFEIFFKRNNIILKKVFGDYYGSEFNSHSPRLILFGLKS